tara:strand:- start:6339 stop:6515 length:177 start_codon:yes stop_codon:yes gene_type:complete
MKIFYVLVFVQTTFGVPNSFNQILWTQNLDVCYVALKSFQSETTPKEKGIYKCYKLVL